MEVSELNLNDLCRLCLEKEEDSSSYHNIFDEGLSNKIIIILSLEVSANDALPKQICRDCRYQLEKSYHFRLAGKNSQQRIKKHIRLVNQKKPSNVLSKEYHDDDTEELEEMYLESYKYFGEAKQEIEKLKLEFETERERIIEEEVHKAIKELATLKRPRRQPSPSADKPPPVLLNKLAPSNQKFDSSPAVKRKQKNEDQQPESIANQFTVGNYEIQFVDHEGKIVDDTQQLFQDEKVTESVSEIEIIEEAQFTEVEEEQEEESAQSDEEYKPPVSIKKKKKATVYEKPPVAKKIKRESNKPLTMLVKKDTPKDNQEDHYFTTIEVDEKDLDENGEKKIFQCAFEECTERFARRQACKTHFYNHLTTKATNGFTCKFCKKCFKVASALERHERVHTGSKPFKCDIKGCEKSFSQKEMLKRHKVIHLSIDDAPFPCQLCNKKFRQKEPLRWHINKEHSEDSETPSYSFSCNICNKTFAHSSGLSRHFLIHSGKTFTCEVCNKAFNDKSALKRHGNVHNK